MTSAEHHIDISPDDTPGDLFRKIAAWYDKTGESMPNRITLGRHTRADDADRDGQAAEREYVAAFRERYGLPEKPNRDSKVYWAELGLTAETSELAVSVVNWATR